MNALTALRLAREIEEKEGELSRLKELLREEGRTLLEEGSPSHTWSFPQEGSVRVTYPSPTLRPRGRREAFQELLGARYGEFVEERVSLHLRKEFQPLLEELDAPTREALHGLVELSENTPRVSFTWKEA
jgi:hypothetical protein